MEEFFAQSRRTREDPDWEHWTPAQREQLLAFMGARAEILERGREARQLLGWNGEKMSELDFKHLRKRALSLWHPDKREAYVASTGKPGADFDETSERVLASLRFLEENAVASGGQVVGW
jgi:hypothetical protein